MACANGVCGITRPQPNYAGPGTIGMNQYQNQGATMPTPSTGFRANTLPQGPAGMPPNFVPNANYNINNRPPQYDQRYTQQLNAARNNPNGSFVETPPLQPDVAYALDQLLRGGFTGIQNRSQQPGFGQEQIRNLFGQTAGNLQNQQEMSPDIQRLLQQTLQGSQGGFNNIVNEEVNRFNTQTIPGLAERFQAMGGQGTGNSSSFQGALGQASNQLGQGLASLKEQYGLQEQGQRQNLLGNLLQQGNQKNALQQNLFGQLLGGGQQNRAQSLQMLQNMLTQGLQPRHEYGFAPAPPSFLSNVGQGLGQGTALAGAGLLRYLTGGLA